MYEAYQRIHSQSEIDGYSIILVASIGLAINIISIVFLRPHTQVKSSNYIDDTIIEGTPSHLVHEEIKNSLLKVKGVTGVFDLHIWTITSGIHALSAHVVIMDHSRSQQILTLMVDIRRLIYKICSRHNQEIFVV